MYKKCKSCKRKFRPHSQVIKQSYCSRQLCQRKRKTLWQREKRRLDPDYKENQKRAQQNWLKRNPDYWRKYRSKKEATKERAIFARLELMAGKSPLPEGFFRLSPLISDDDAKMDVWIVEIKVLPNTSRRRALRKERT